MRSYHIIEQTADQQTTEIWADSQEQAITAYLDRALQGDGYTIERIDHNTMRANASGEYCTIITQTERIVFVRWAHCNGLY